MDYDNMVLSFTETKRDHSTMQKLKQYVIRTEKSHAQQGDTTINRDPNTRDNYSLSRTKISQPNGGHLHYCQQHRS